MLRRNEGHRPTTADTNANITELPSGASGSALASDALGLEIINTQVRHHPCHRPSVSRSSQGSLLMRPMHFVHNQSAPRAERQSPQPKVPHREQAPVAFTSGCAAQIASPAGMGSGNAQ